MRRTSAAFAAGALALTTLLGAAPKPAVIAAAAKETLQSGAASALSIAVVRNGRIAYAQTFGPARADTAFSVGSVTKMFTAVSVMQLVQRGLVSLDAPASTYLPQYPVLQRVTVRELLNHTGGLPNILDDAVASGDVQRPATPGAMLTKALALPLDFTPGTDWNYSNTGYVVLGQIVERVSGMPLAAYEQRNIFAPVGMQHTYVAPAPGTNVASAFKGAPGDWTWYYAAGDIFASATDLARFDIALMRGRLVSSGMFQQMVKTAPFPTLAPGMRDGLGLFLTQTGDVQLIGHHGGEPGFRADNEMIPARGFAAIVLGSGNYDTQPLLLAAIRTYVPGAKLTGGPPAVVADQAPAVTQRLTSFLRDLQQGKVDSDQLELVARTLFPSGKDIAGMFAPYGALREVRFQSKLYASTGKLYLYRADFAKGALYVQFVMDRDGKYASFTMQPVKQPQ